MPSFPPLTRCRRRTQGIGPVLLRRQARTARTRWGPGVVRVAGLSMFPTLAAGDACLVWWSPRTRPRPGRVVVARLPGRPGVLAVKRVTGRRDGAWWLEGDNPAASTDSWQVGPVAGDHVIGWVLLRYWPRPGVLAGPGVCAPRGGQGRAASESSSAR